MSLRIKFDLSNSTYEYMMLFYGRVLRSKQCFLAVVVVVLLRFESNNSGFGNYVLLLFVWNFFKLCNYVH